MVGVPHRPLLPSYMSHARYAPAEEPTACREKIFVLYVLQGAQSGEAREEREREREEAQLALRAIRPHTVGYIGRCDQEDAHAVPVRACRGAHRLPGSRCMGLECRSWS